MKEEIVSSRRAVLRGALTAGCTLWMPIVLSGCGEKTAEKTTTIPAPAASGPVRTDGNAPVDKVTQTSVQYQLQPKGEQKCGVCTHFNAESTTCKLVDGQISPEGWCVLWAAKV